MKIRLLALAMLLCTFAAKAQYVTIPDPAFALFLQQTYPNCMNGNQMDTTCSEIVNETTVNCSHANIANLDGIQYFDSLRQLDCSFNSITNMPRLPHYLLELYCSFNLIDSFSFSLPDSLTSFFCDSNRLYNLPVLPGGLLYLNCEENHIVSLPAIPETLLELYCGYNPITALPLLPNSLNSLYCYSADLTYLDSLPQSLINLGIDYNQIAAIPTLPLTLEYLTCDSNYLQSLPNLPSSLTHLSFGQNAIPAYPTLPSGLLYLNCSQNPITNLSGLPAGLKSLYCEAIFANTLPILPPNLVLLFCAANGIQSLPTLPATLTQLSCYANNIITLPAIPPALSYLHCSQNPITQIPDLPAIYYLSATYCPNLTTVGHIPDTLGNLHFSNSPNLLCMPKFKHIRGNLGFQNTGITCLPQAITVMHGSTPAIDSFPICNQFNNPNGCTISANISGYAYADRDNNCNFDGTDIGQYGLKHSLYSNGILLEQTYSNNIGNYSFDQTGFGNFETRLDTLGLPFTIGCPVGGVYYDTLTANDSIHFNRDFALQCETGFDLAAKSVASAMIFRPANYTVVDIHAGDLANFYSASCAQGVSGVVTVTLNGPMTYISPAPGAVAPSNVANNVLTWNVADFGTADALKDYNIIIQTDTFAQSGQQACFDVKVTPLTGDNDTSNNYLYFCFDIVNSYDPNDKTAYPSGNIDTTQEWLTYTVRFQNTGTAEAQHIYIMDTLDANVKVETFQLLSYSHQPNVQINENIVRFNFPNINLPDSISDEPGSHGYVQYKVKLKDDLAIGTAINNTAYIYFDFNSPVVTNTATNTIAVEEDTVVGIRSISKTFDLLIYPNPANQHVTVTASEPGQAVAIYNAQGKLISTQTMQGNAETLNVAALPSGVYYIEVSGKNIIARKKFVKL